MENKQIILAESKIKSSFSGNTATGLTPFEKRFTHDTLSNIFKKGIRTYGELYDYLIEVGTQSCEEPNRIYWVLVKHCKLNLGMIKSHNEGMSFSSLRNFLVNRNSNEFKTLKSKRK
jgi:hypothetical protein